MPESYGPLGESYEAGMRTEKRVEETLPQIPEMPTRRLFHIQDSEPVYKLRNAAYKEFLNRLDRLDELLAREVEVEPVPVSP